MIDKAIIWNSYTIRVDMHTGEVITKWKAEQHYIKHKTTKNVKLNEIKTRGTIEYTIEYRRNPQGKLFETD